MKMLTTLKDFFKKANQFLRLEEVEIGKISNGGWSIGLNGSVKNNEAVKHDDNNGNNNNNDGNK